MSYHVLQHRLDRIVVSTPHCGCGNPGSIPGLDLKNYFSTFLPFSDRACDIWVTDRHTEQAAGSVHVDSIARAEQQRRYGIVNYKHSLSRQLWCKMPPLSDFSKTLADIIKGYKSKEEAEWESVYQELVSIIVVNDDVPILDEGSAANRKRLRYWLLHQEKELDKLNDDQRSKIQGIIDRFDNELGIPLKDITKKTCSNWFLKYKEMNREIERIGKDNSSSYYKEMTPSLSKWVENQKVAMRDNTIEVWQISLLQKSGIKPAAQKTTKKRKAEDEDRWDEYYELLKAFKEQTGHFAVPKKLNLKFAKWVQDQKRYMRDETLRPDRKEKLESIGLKCTK